MHGLRLLYRAVSSACLGLFFFFPGWYSTNCMAGAMKLVWSCVVCRVYNSFAWRVEVRRRGVAVVILHGWRADGGKSVSFFLSFCFCWTVDILFKAFLTGRL